MRPVPYRLGEEELVALGGGDDVTKIVERLAAAQYDGRMLLLWGVMDTARRAGHPEAERVRHGYELLARLQRRYPGVAGEVLRHPAAGAWAFHTLRGLRGEPTGPAARPAGLAALAAAVLVKSGAEGAVEVPVVDGAVTLPSLGQAMLGTSDRFALVRSGAAGAEVIATGARVAIPADAEADAPGWRGMRALAAGAGKFTIRVLVDDLDPFRMPGALVNGRLTAAEAAEWRAVFHDAWQVLVTGHPVAAAEVAAVMRAITPLERPPTGQRSATSSEAFGAVAVSRPVDAPALAAALVHEVQHSKLNAVIDIVPLVRPGVGHRRYYAPWRDDPRPPAGLLQGAFAHLAVSGFWRRQRHREGGAAAIRAHAEYARWRAGALQVTRALLTERLLTEPGKVLASAMLRTLTAWQAEPVPREAAVRARREAELHRRRWRARNRMAIR